MGANLSAANTALINNMCPISNQFSVGSRLQSMEALVNTGFGKVYWVDKSTGSDSNDGLSIGAPFLTIAAAITASNLTCGSYNMNTIYVNAHTYSEALTVLPKNCNVVGIGAKTRIGSVCTIAAGTQNCHFWNIRFRQAPAAPNVTIPSTSYTIGFHGCFFEGTAGSQTHGLYVNDCQDLIVEDCEFLGNPIFPIAIEIAGLNIRGIIRRNRIAATTAGILVSHAVDCYGTMIYENMIGRQYADPNSTAQMTRGISLTKATGTNKVLIVNNRIEAVDGIYSASSDTQFQNLCIGNIVNEAGTSVYEDAI